MTLLDQSLLWLIPYILLILLMVHAMMEFTTSLLVERPRRNRTPVPAPELLNRLLTLNRNDLPILLTPGTDCDLQIAWEQGSVPGELEDTSQPGRHVLSSQGSSDLVRILLDEMRHEVRINQVTRSHHILIGIVGRLPRLEMFFGFQAGPPGQELTREISRAALSSGWAVRPVLWWFQATRSGYRSLERLTPPPLRKIPARWFWGVLYPLLYVLAMVYLASVIGPLGRDQWLLLLGISAVWWVAWGFLVWLLVGLPKRRKPTRR
jgi:hypothetical protein